MDFGIPSGGVWAADVILGFSVQMEQEFEIGSGD